MSQDTPEIPPTPTPGKMDRVRDFVRSRYGRAAIVASAIIFLWRLGYRDSHSSVDLWNAQGSWHLASVSAKWFEEGSGDGGFGKMLTDIAEAAVETAVIAVAIVALAMAIRWVMRRRP